ncbi:MAG: NAD-dependent epimerase/dehydratase family protein [Betaproteobacteria bacterium]|nr:NAD-dependent epimerase/dehydratase family protein [Betaproteobacteria bacterium]
MVSDSIRIVRLNARPALSPDYRSARAGRVVARSASARSAAVSRPLPRRLRRPTLVVVGCGDVGLRLIAQRVGQPNRLRIIATARRPEQLAAIRAAGAIALACDLDDRRSVSRLSALSRWMVHLAPPPAEGTDDRRTRWLTAACSKGTTAWAAARLSYVSTTGVYGDCAGAQIDETRPLQPSNPRAARRVAAEQTLRAYGSRTGTRVTLLRAPGIYAQDRLPLERLRQGQPALLAAEDVYTNHIHADDLAHAAWLALFRARGGRSFNICDDTDLRMGDYFDVVADATGLPRPPRMSRAEVAARVSPMMLSFMRDSRRISNTRMKRELRLRLQVADVHALLALL